MPVSGKWSRVPRASLNTTNLPTMAFLEEYFDRIGFKTEERPPPSLDTLKELHHLHPKSIPFENIDVVVGKPVSVDPEAVKKKLVSEKRGGYCLEQNVLFNEVLREIGFQTKIYLARVVWVNKGPDYLPPTHVFLGVIIDGEEFVADVGFGGQTLSGPLLLKTGLEQKVPKGLFRLTKYENAELPYDKIMLEVKLKDEWKSIYCSNLSPQRLSDLQVQNWWTSANPNSPFLKRLILAKHTETESVNLLNLGLTIYHHDTGEKETHALTLENILEVLEERFTISVPELETELKAFLSKIST